MNLKKSVSLLVSLFAIALLCGCHKPGVDQSAKLLAARRAQLKRMDVLDKLMVALAHKKCLAFQAVTNASGGKLLMTVNIGERKPIIERHVFMFKGDAWRYACEPLLYKKHSVKPEYIGRNLIIVKKDFEKVFLDNPDRAFIIGLMRTKLNEYWRRGMLENDDICVNLIFEFMPAEYYQGKTAKVYYERHRLALVDGNHWNYQLANRPLTVE